MVDLVLKNGQIVTPEGIFNGGIAIENGRIVAVCGDAFLPSHAKTIDVKGKHIIPGVVDPESHAGHSTPFPETCRTESRAAAASGVTTWGYQSPAPRLVKNFKLDPGPEDVLSYHKVLPEAIDIGESNSAVDFFLTPQIETDEQAREVEEYAKKFGVTSYKFYGHCKRIDIAQRYWYPRKTGLVTGFDDGTVYLAFESAARVAPPAVVCLHCENYEIARLFIDRLKAAGRKDLAAWSDKTPPFAEAHQVIMWSYLAKMTRCPIYIQHVTTEETANAIQEAKHKGVKIYGQTSPQYLCLSNRDGDGWKINTPLRDPATMEYLWRALASGLIDCIGSDHVVGGLPKERYLEDRKVGDVWKSTSGYSSRVESHLPLMLSEGVNKGKITFERLVEVACEAPAKIFGIYPKKGAIQVGADADLVVIDMGMKVKLDSDMLHTGSGWSIYEGREFHGWPIMTMIRGEIVAEWRGRRNEVLAKPGTGKHIRRRVGYDHYPIDQES